MSAAVIPSHLTPSAPTDADWSFDILFTDGGEPADFTGSTFSLVMSPESKTQSGFAFVLDTDGGAIAVDENRIMVRVPAAEMAERRPLKYRWELREHQPDGDIVALAVGRQVLVRGLSLDALEGVAGGGAGSITGITSFTVRRSPEGVQVIRNASGPAGKSAYQLAKAAGYPGSLEQWLIDTGADGQAEAARVAAEQARAAAESARVAAETSRLSVESARVTAEAARVSAESGRATIEGQRVTAEAARVAAESSRVTVEAARVTAEAARVAAEASRVTVEGQRVTAEAVRVAAEGARVTAEAARVTAEAARVAAEVLRQTNTAAAIAATLALPIRVITGTTGTIVSTDAGKVVECTNVAGCALTISNAVPAEFVTEVRACMAGAGLVTMAMQAGGTLRNADGLSKLRKQWSSVTLHCRANAGAVAEVVAIGDLTV